MIVPKRQEKQLVKWTVISLVLPGWPDTFPWRMSSHWAIVNPKRGVHTQILTPCSWSDDRRGAGLETETWESSPGKTQLEEWEICLDSHKVKENTMAHYKENYLRNILCEQCPCAFEKSYMHLIISSNKRFFLYHWHQKKKKMKTVPPLDWELLQSFRLLSRPVLPLPVFMPQLQFLFRCPMGNKRHFLCLSSQWMIIPVLGTYKGLNRQTCDLVNHFSKVFSHTELLYWELNHGPSCSNAMHISPVPLKQFLF